MTTEQKAAFLQEEYPQLLAGIAEGTQAKWGKMGLQHMIEHMADSFRMANGKDLYDLKTPEEQLPQYRSFLMSEKPFRENTKASYLGDSPAALRFERIEDALGELRMEIADFKDLFLQDKQKTVTNPVFGDLDYELWVQLLYKHAWHHLRQFGVEPGGQ